MYQKLQLSPYIQELTCNVLQWQNKSAYAELFTMRWLQVVSWCYLTTLSVTLEYRTLTGEWSGDRKSETRWKTSVEASWNVMAHALKPDLVFPRNGRVQLNQRGCQASRLLAAEVCASAVVMLDTPCSEVVWRVLATHSILQFPLHFPTRASPCAITFQLESIASAFCWRIWRSRKTVKITDVSAEIRTGNMPNTFTVQR